MPRRTHQRRRGHAATSNQPEPRGEPRAVVPGANQSRDGLNLHPRGQPQTLEVACQEGTAHTSWERGESSKVQVEHAGTMKSRLVRQRRGGEEKGTINRTLSIPQHLRDRGIAVIRPRGRKLGLWERKPRLEEAAKESEVEDCYCIQANVRQGGRGGEEREKEAYVENQGREQRSRSSSEEQRAAPHQGIAALPAML